MTLQAVALSLRFAFTRTFPCRMSQYTTTPPRARPAWRRMGGATSTALSADHNARNRIHNVCLEPFWLIINSYLE